MGKMLLVGAMVASAIALGDQDVRTKIGHFLSQPAAAQTQSVPGITGTQSEDPKKALGSIGADVKKRLQELNGLLDKLDKAAKGQSAKDTQQATAELASELGKTADATSANGAIEGRIASVRAAALALRDQAMADKKLSEQERQRVVEVLGQTIDLATNTQIFVADTHKKLVDMVQTVQQKQVYFGYLLRAGEIQDALKEVVAWCNALRETIGRLERLIPAGPTAEAVPTNSGAVPALKAAAREEKPAATAPRPSNQPSYQPGDAWLKPSEAMTPPASAPERSSQPAVQHAVYRPSGAPASASEKPRSDPDEMAQRRGWLGVRIQPITAQSAAELGIPLGQRDGVIVASVLPDSPAAKAGIREGDVIIAAGGETLRSASDLPRIVAGSRIGEPLPLKVRCRCGSDIRYAPVVAELPKTYQ